jgi:hypothetical protein
MSNRLLDRQRSLLEYLTSGTAIFGAACAKTDHRAPWGIEPGLLRHEALFSFDKRIAKIAAVLPLTFSIIKTHGSTILREFAEACPPEDISKFGNARQFCGFLRERSRGTPLAPPCLGDVAACELAFAQVRSRGDERKLMAETDGQCIAIRRHPDAIFVQCSYDVRPIFEAAGEAAIPMQRNTSIAVSIPPGGEAPQVFEMNAALFDILGTCHTWTDPVVFGATDG